MKKELRNQIEDFIEYNIELKRLCDENFKDKIEKDIVLFWIAHMNFRIYSMQTQGNFQYNSSKLSYGIEEIKLDIKQLTEEQFQEILEFYLKKGYTLNHLNNIVIENPDVIVINWDKPNRQTIKDKMYILKFKYNKFRNLYNINRRKADVLKAFFESIKDFYWYLFWNHSYCLNAITQNRKTRKSIRVIKRRKKFRTFISKIGHNSFTNL